MDFPPTAMIRDALSSKFDSALSSLESKTCHSWKMALDRSQLMPTNTDVGGEANPQIFMRLAEGCRLTDIDDNTFIDLCMGFGANLLGHNPNIIERAISEQLRKGWNFGFRGESQLPYARLLHQAGMSNEQVLLCASGTEATALAMRAARAFTGKDSIGIFSGSYHGALDYGLVVAAPGKQHGKAHIGAGVPKAIDAVVEPLPYGSTKAFERIRTLSEKLAAVIVEPVQSSCPVSDDGLWLKQLEAVCKEAGVLIILDEVMTGFRLSYGGGQEIFDLSPDLITYGKAIAGGLPVGALAGKSDVMSCFTPDSRGVGVFSGSAFAGNPLTIAAGIATLSYLQSHRSTLYPDLEQRTSRFANRVNAQWSGMGLPLRFLHFGSLMRLVCQHEPVRHARDIKPVFRNAENAFMVHALERGVSIHASRRAFISAAHTDEDIDLLVDALTIAGEQTAADGLFRASA
jgi:glutamate-1-semialdehyde-2,1-aminomutase